MKIMKNKIYRLIRYVLKKINYIVKKPFYHEVVDDISVEVCYRKLEKIHHNNTRSSIAHNEFQKETKVDLQIIIPCYNVECYIQECMLSILNQETKYTLNIVIVNDGSSDNTLNLIKSINDNRVIIIDQPNGGAAKARNHALKSLFGRYIMFVDADDIIPAGAIDLIMNEAIHTNADIVEGQYKIMLNKEEEYRIYDNKHFEMKEIKPTELEGFCWGKVYKRAIWMDRCFPEGNMYEDTCDAFTIYTKAKKIVKINVLVYLYRINHQGVTSHMAGNIEVLDTIYVTNQLLEDRVKIGEINDRDFLDVFLKQIKINVKRTSFFDSDIQKIIFFCHRDMFIRYFENEKGINSLTKALYNRDFGQYMFQLKYK